MIGFVEKDVDLGTSLFEFRELAMQGIHDYGRFSRFFVQDAALAISGDLPNLMSCITWLQSTRWSTGCKVLVE